MSIQQEQLKLADEMNQELIQLRNENWLLKQKVRIEDEAVAVKNAIPRLGAIRDKVLNELKVGRQSAAGKAVNAFIKELEKLPPDTQQPELNTQHPDLNNLAVRLLVKLAVNERSKHNTDNRYFDDLRRIATMCGYRLFHTSNGYQAKDVATNELTYTTSELGGVAEWLTNLSPTL